MTQQPLIEELRRLRRYVGKDMALLLGGRTLEDHVQILEKVDAKYISDIEQFSQELHSLLIATVGQGEAGSRAPLKQLPNIIKETCHV